MIKKLMVLFCTVVLVLGYSVMGLGDNGVARLIGLLGKPQAECNSGYIWSGFVGKEWREAPMTGVPRALFEIPPFQMIAPCHIHLSVSKKVEDDLLLFAYNAHFFGRMPNAEIVLRAMRKFHGDVIEEGHWFHEDWDKRIDKVWTFSDAASVLWQKSTNEIWILCPTVPGWASNHTEGTWG